MDDCNLCAPWNERLQLHVVFLAEQHVKSSLFVPDRRTRLRQLVSHDAASGDLCRNLLRVGAVAAVLEPSATAAGDAIQHRDLVEFARLAFASHAHQQLPWTVDSAQPSAGPREQIQRFVQQADRTSRFHRGSIRPHITQRRPLTADSRLHKLVNYRGVGGSLALEHANVVRLASGNAATKSSRVFSAYR